MKPIIPVIAIASTAGMGLQFNETDKSRKSVEVQIEELKETLAETNAQLEVANKRLIELAGRPVQVSAPTSNWVDERNRSWVSPLTKGASDNRRVMSSSGPVFIPVVPNTTTATSRSTYPNYSRPPYPSFGNPPPPNPMPRPLPGPGPGPGAGPSSIIIQSAPPPLPSGGPQPPPPPPRAP